MKLLNKALLISISMITFSCGETGDKETNPQTYNIDHFNIIITTDLSNRLKSDKPFDDYRIVETTVTDILPKVLSHDRETDQEDIYSISLTSERAINKYSIDVNKLKIDFKQFESQIDRIEYINNTAQRTLAKDRQAFLGEYNKILKSAAASPEGADIWNYFDQRVDKTLIINKSDTISDAGEKFVNRHRNIMILLTDGYIEAGLYGKRACKENQCYYLSSDRINELRRAYNSSGMDSIEEFFKKNNYGIIPASNPSLNNLEVLLMQVEDRSLDNSGNITVHPTDREIINLFWKDWLNKSGVKRVGISPLMTSKDQTEEVILDFIGI